MSPTPTENAPPLPRDLAGREIVVGVCGSIAVYKIADTVSKLVQRGAGVTVCMSAAAQKFVTPLTFQTLTARPVRTGTFETVDPADTQHIALTERADLMVIAPATNDIIAKVAHGLCDDLISLMICAAACPVVFVPAMNNRMWDNPIAQENVAKLTRLGYRFIGPDAGWLACRNQGSGRLSDPVHIVDEIASLLAQPAKNPIAPPKI